MQLDDPAALQAEFERLYTAISPSSSSTSSVVVVGVEKEVVSPFDSGEGIVDPGIPSTCVSLFALLFVE